MFTAFDYAVMAVIGLSALRGTWRGFLSEIFGLIGWIAAFFIACRFGGYVVQSPAAIALYRWRLSASTFISAEGCSIALESCRDASRAHRRMSTMTTSFRQRPSCTTHEAMRPRLASDQSIKRTRSAAAHRVTRSTWMA